MDSYHFIRHYNNYPKPTYKLSVYISSQTTLPRLFTSNPQHKRYIKNGRRRRCCKLTHRLEQCHTHFAYNLLHQLVIDNGSGMCKAGFAGDDAPRAVSSLRDRELPTDDSLLTRTYQTGVPFYRWETTSCRCDDGNGQQGQLYR